MVNPIQQTAAASDKNSGANIIDERLFLERALEQFEGFAQAKMNDGIERFALDFLAGKSGIVFQQNGFAWQAIAQNTTTLLEF